MKLREVVLNGRFCGLKTIEECILNWYLHFPYAYNSLQWDYENSELKRDLKAWEAGELELDEERINTDVAQMEKEYEEYIDSLPPMTEEEQIDFDLTFLK